MKETVLSKPQVLKRLHLSLEQFRSLCLIRGIHPRQYKQKKYFYRKADVHSLIRSEEIQAVRKKQAIDYSSLLQMRFPAFIDILPHLSDIVHGVLIHSQNITILSKLYSELSRIGAFQKCFISVKGIYLGVSIEQISQLWIQPYSSTISTPSKAFSKLCYEETALLFICHHLSRFNSVKGTVLSSMTFSFSNEVQEIFSFLVLGLGGTIVNEGGDCLVCEKIPKKYNFNITYVHPQWTRSESTRLNSSHIPLSRMPSSA
eukprot:TRINITY_DN294_c0_g1_i1.p1 TRINITY_DN294_c0_g1~~TRINITY_DN294_c0_g1_i1.p1  ORF type:complete len:259 (-),score=11.80 TRINITY_DN294_c0_g1_i1:77-853(-)